MRLRSQRRKKRQEGRVHSEPEVRDDLVAPTLQQHILSLNQRNVREHDGTYNGGKLISRQIKSEEINQILQKRCYRREKLGGRRKRSRG